MVQDVVAETLDRRHAKGWLVGGTVRDRRLDRFSPDLDIAVMDDPEAVAREVAARLGAPWFPLSARHGAYRVMTVDGHVDIAALQGAAIEDDLARRDFTVNAMALPLGGGAVLDPFGGRDHLRAGLLVAVSDSIFRDDPLRLMRAVRFCHVLGMRFHPDLERLLRAEAPLVTRAAAERVTTEMALTLEHGHVAVAARLWDDLGLLTAILPEIGSVADMSALERLDSLLYAPGCLVGPGGAEVLARRLALPVDGIFARPVALRLAVLCRCLTPEQATSAGRRLKLSAPMQSLLRAVAAWSSSASRDGDGLATAAQSRRATVSFLWSVEPWEPEILLLAASVLGGGSEREIPPADEGTSSGPLRTLFTAWLERTSRGAASPPVGGAQLMAELGLSPGPVVGRLVREVRLAWEAGEATSVAGLLDVARAAWDRLGG